MSRACAVAALIIAGIVVVVVVLIGCEMPPTSRSFSHTMKDGSSFTISIDYKPNSEMVKDEKIGVYYFIARFHDARSEIERFEKNQPPWPRLIRFCDEKGHPLFRYSLSNFLPLSAFKGKWIDRVYEWRGRFYEQHMTLENFRDIAYIEVEY